MRYYFNEEKKGDLTLGDFEINEKINDTHFKIEFNTQELLNQKGFENNTQEDMIELIKAVSKSIVRFGVFNQKDDKFLYRATTNDFKPFYLFAKNYNDAERIVKKKTNNKVIKLESLDSNFL